MGHSSKTTLAAAVCVASVVGVCVLRASARAAPPASAASIDADFQAFWRAGNSRDAAKAADRLVRDGVDFATAWERLRKGRPYAAAPTGRRIQNVYIAGLKFENIVEIPANYEPSRPWTVRVQLHGGINRPEPQDPLRRRPNSLSSDNEIHVLPIGWNDARWWYANQVDNVLALLDQVKRSYNVDESRAYLTGISDGGTGVYFLAMREATPWSACLPLIGNLRVLSNADTRADGELYAGNLVNCPFFIVNSERDPLYPAAQIQPHVDLMRRAGVALIFHPQALAGHDTSWWPAEKAAYEQFVREHPRQPYAERLSWETERTDRYNRLRWLVVDALGATPHDTALESVNTFTPAGGSPQPMFERHVRPGQSGRVDITRRGNAIDAQTRGVRAFTLLLSPDVFDFGSPVTVTVNGRPAFQGSVRKDPAVLLKWAARDNDRTLLVGAELKIIP
jgi:predicted esterase